MLQTRANTTILTIIILTAVAGIISTVSSPTIKQQANMAFQIFAAQQNSIQSLGLAKELLYYNKLPTCKNSPQCPFWDNYRNLRLTTKSGKPNKAWWRKNAYKPYSNSSMRFIITNAPNNMHKIIAYAEDQSGEFASIIGDYVARVTY